MTKFQNHWTEWEVSILELTDGTTKRWKVTRRIPALAIVETKVLKSRSKAKRQLDEWLQ